MPLARTPYTHYCGAEDYLVVNCRGRHFAKYGKNGPQFNLTSLYATAIKLLNSHRGGKPFFPRTYVSIMRRYRTLSDEHFQEHGIRGCAVDSCVFCTIRNYSSKHRAFFESLSSQYPPSRSTDVRDPTPQPQLLQRPPSRFIDARNSATEPRPPQASHVDSTDSRQAALPREPRAQPYQAQRAVCGPSVHIELHKLAIPTRALCAPTHNAHVVSRLFPLVPIAPSCYA